MVCTFSTKYTEDAYFFEVNTRYISSNVCLFVCCLTSQVNSRETGTILCCHNLDNLCNKICLILSNLVNSYGHGGTVNSLDHTFFLSKKQA